MPVPSSLSTSHPLLHCLGELLLLRLFPNLSHVSGAASTEIGRHCQHRSTGHSRVAVVEVGTCAEKKKKILEMAQLSYRLIVT